MSNTNLSLEVLISLKSIGDKLFWSPVPIVVQLINASHSDINDCNESQENQSTFQQTSFSGKIDFGHLGHGYTIYDIFQRK